MDKFQRINQEMSYKEAEEYIELICDDLEQIYQDDEPRGGRAGMIWRTIWDKPRKITPLSLFLSEKHIEEILSSEADKKESLKRANRKTTLERKKNTELTIQLDDASKYKKAYEVGHANAMKKDINYLLDRCKKAGVYVDLGDLHSFNIGKKITKPPEDETDPESI